MPEPGLRAPSRSWSAATCWHSWSATRVHGRDSSKMLCRRLRHTDQHIAEIALLELPVRLAKLLLRMSSVDATPAPGRKQEVRIQLSQRELGNFVGAARESVNKCLGDWQRAGIVRIDSGQITITDRAALEELAAQG